MDSTMMSSRPHPPSSRSSVSTHRGKFFGAPLTHHGMPKTPLPTSPGGSFRSHRFSSLRSPMLSPSLNSPPLTPMSPMSPPMSAKSFGTFIESEPSTPAYSPRAGSSNWDSNTLLLLSPVSSAPSSPCEPVWEMMGPVKKPTSNKSSAHPRAPSSRSQLRPTHDRTISISSSETTASTKLKPGIQLDQKENTPPTENETDAEIKPQAESSHTAPLGRLATRMKSMLRRKMPNEKKTQKRRRQYAELDRMEDVHWTEM